MVDGTYDHYLLSTCRNSVYIRVIHAPSGQLAALSTYGKIKCFCGRLFTIFVYDRVHFSLTIRIG